MVHGIRHGLRTETFERTNCKARRMVRMKSEIGGGVAILTCVKAKIARNEALSRTIRL